MSLYFAYGSNLDAQDRQRWCRASGRRLSLQPTGQVAWLPDRLLRFHYRSTTRAGGCLDIVPAVGHLSAGALFTFDAADLASLDAKEGHPNWYQRLDVQVLLADGRSVAALTYEVSPGRRTSYVPPADGYVAAVARGRAAHGIPDDGHLDAAAQNRPAPHSVRHVFVYGTLKPGQARHDLLAPHVAGPPVATTVRGELRDLGPYPALLPGEAAVCGVLLALRDPASALPPLDAYEGCDPDLQSRSLYRRTVLTTACGTRAWTWRWAGPPTGRPLPHGTWPPD